MGLAIHADATREASKPGRTGVHDGLESDAATRWLLHASATWTEAHLSDPPDVVGKTVAAAFIEARGAHEATVLDVHAHLWRYAQGHLPDARGALFDGASRLAVCGDWLNGSRVEGALTSGLAAAGRLLGVAAALS